MKKSYQKPEFKKVNFSYEQAVVASPNQCFQGWTNVTSLNPLNNECNKCFTDVSFVDSITTVGVF